MASTNTLCKSYLMSRLQLSLDTIFLQMETVSITLPYKLDLIAGMRMTVPSAIDDANVMISRAELLKNGGVWTGGSIIVEIEYRTHRIEFPEHGVLVADVPWAYPDSGFTKDFDLTVGWLAIHLPRSAVSAYMRIDWKTVGRCVSRTLNEIEPERNRRLNGLVNIGIDETSYRKGHKYITVMLTTTRIPLSGLLQATANPYWRSFINNSPRSSYPPSRWLPEMVPGGLPIALTSTHQTVNAVWIHSM